VPNDIPARQNSPNLLRYVHASSQAYVQAKGISGWQSHLLLAAAIAGPAVAAIHAEAAIVGALLAVIVAVIDFAFLEPAVKRYQELGAKLKEMFDTELMGMNWNTHRVGSKPSPEETLALAEEFKKTAKLDVQKKKEDWYPVEVAPVPLEYARLICQRSSMHWDASLRKYYVFYFFVMIALLGCGAILYAGFRQISFNQFALAVMAPLVPAALKLWREAKKHHDSAAASERARGLLEGFWKQAIERPVPAAEMLEEARRLQDELFDRRKLSPTVPEMFYTWQREAYEQQMKYGAQVMVDQALSTLGGGHPAACGPVV
jgi:hypothetical protein